MIRTLLHLENLPKFLDGLDGGLYLLRTRLAGGFGFAVQNTLAWLALGLAMTAHPISRATALAALGMYLSAALLHRAANLPRSMCVRNSAPR